MLLLYIFAIFACMFCADTSKRASEVYQRSDSSSNDHVEVQMSNLHIKEAHESKHDRIETESISKSSKGNFFHLNKKAVEPDFDGSRENQEINSEHAESHFKEKLDSRSDDKAEKNFMTEKVNENQKMTRLESTRNPEQQKEKQVQQTSNKVQNSGAEHTESFLNDIDFKSRDKTNHQEVQKDTLLKPTSKKIEHQEERLTSCSSDSGQDRSVEHDDKSCNRKGITEVWTASLSESSTHDLKYEQKKPKHEDVEMSTLSKNLHSNQENKQEKPRDLLNSLDEKDNKDAEKTTLSSVSINNRLEEQVPELNHVNRGKYRSVDRASSVSFRIDSKDVDQKGKKDPQKQALSESSSLVQRKEQQIKQDFANGDACGSDQLRPCLGNSDSSDTEENYLKQDRNVNGVDKDHKSAPFIVVIGVMFGIAYLSMNMAMLINIQFSIWRITDKLDLLISRSSSDKVRHPITTEMKGENAAQAAIGRGLRDIDKTTISNSANSEKPLTHKRGVIFSAISFQGGSAQRSHTQMAETFIQRKEVKKLLTRPGMQSTDVPLFHILVTSEADIEHLHPSKVTFVFIDHSEGDRLLVDHLRQKAVQHAMEVSTTIVVVYCWDTQSKDLELGQLFSPRLEDSITNSLLLTIRKRQSFYSIYKQFTYFQQRHLTNRIASILETKAILPTEENSKRSQSVAQ